MKSDDRQNDDNEMPQWKRALEERKNRNRPKSADLLSEKSEEPSWKRDKEQKIGRSSPNRPKSMDVLSEKDQKPAWQLEAEKRMAARQGGYVDPEKNKIDQGVKNVKKVEKDNQNDVNRRSPVRGMETRSKSPLSTKSEEKTENKTTHVTKRILPNAPVSQNKAADNKEADRKKISVDTKFKFNLDFEKKDKEKDAGKPPRPPPISPVSLRPTNGHVTGEGGRFSSNKSHAAPLRPQRPPGSEIKTFVSILISFEILNLMVFSASHNSLLSKIAQTDASHDSK